MMKSNPLLDIRIGTLVPGNANTVDTIREIKRHGFESFSITFWRTLADTDLAELARGVRDAIGDDDIRIQCVGIYGNALGDEPIDAETRAGWEALVDAAPLFGADVVAGFAGRVAGRVRRGFAARRFESFTRRWLRARRTPGCGWRLRIATWGTVGRPGPGTSRTRRPRGSGCLTR